MGSQVILTKPYNFVQGEMGANVLVGMQILEQDEMEFIECANLLGYDYENECNNAAFKLLMR